MVDTLRLRHLLLVFGISAIFLFVPSTSEAQLSNLIPGLSPEISFEPRFPDPGEVVTVRLSTHTFTSVGASITWLLNGVEESSLANQTSFELVAGELGEEVTLEARVSARDGNFVVRGTLRASALDIIVESDTVTPTFYEGRALPSAGAMVSVVAIPHVGSDLPPESLYYTWSTSNESLDGGPVRGKQRADFELENGSSKTVFVSITDGNGEVVVERALIVDDFTPILRFHEDNPLRGISPLPLGDTFSMTAEEVGIRAVPYYMSRDVYSSSAAQYEWRVGGRTVENPSVDPFLIALRKSGSGSATLSFEVMSLRDLLQQVSGQLTLVFGT